MERPRVLVIDDDPNIRRTLSDILNAKGYEPISAKNGAEGLGLLKTRQANVALVDLQMPGVSGLEVLGRIRSDYPSTEVIILTGNATLDSAIEATNKGAFSFMQKPYEIDQLLLHIRRAVEKQMAEIEKIRLYDEVRSLSLHDPLTGLANRRSLNIQAEKLHESAKRYNRPLSAIMLDIDHFKMYNDTYGHLEGDKVLIRVAAILSRLVRNADYAFRYGGEEFLILLPETGAADAYTLAERLRDAVETGTEVTISLGLCSFPCPSIEDLIKKADSALYQAKQTGRNKVEKASDDQRNERCA